MKVYEFDAIIQKVEGIDAAFVEFPFNVEKEFGVKGQVKVVVAFDGVEYRGSLARMGHLCHFVGITKEIRKIIGKNPGDTVHVILRKDQDKRTVEIPTELLKVFDEFPKSKAAFNTLSFTNQKEIVLKIISAKKETTRSKRIETTIHMLLDLSKKNISHGK